MKKALFVIIGLLCLCMLVACGRGAAKNQDLANVGSAIDMTVDASDTSRQHGAYQLLISGSGDGNTAEPASTVTILLGDVDGNGKITNADILKLYRYLYNSTLYPLPTITQTEHSLISHDAKAPTCTEPGWEKYVSCSCCDQSTYIEIPATGHSEVYHDAKAPTKTEIGWEAYVTCENCDYTTYVELPTVPFYTDGLQFTLNTEETEYSVTGYTGTDATVIIPTTYEGLPVTSIGDKAFCNCNKIENIEIPDGITSIGYDAFTGCVKLTSITIPDSVTSFAINTSSYTYNLRYYYGWFKACVNLKTVVLGSGIQNIPDKAFHMCTNLESIVIPEGVTSIGDSAFIYCSGLVSIDIPNGVTSIGNKAFYLCTDIASIHIPNSVISIGSDAFAGCESLTSITIPDSVTSFEINHSHDYYDSTYNSYGWFKACVNLKTVVLGSGIQNIPDKAFYECTSLTSIYLSDSVTSIGSHAFYNCTRLESIVIPDSITSIGSSAFSSGNKLTTVYYTGTEEQWSAISIGSDNTPLTNATIVYNYNPS